MVSSIILGGECTSLVRIGDRVIAVGGELCGAHPHTSEIIYSYHDTLTFYIPPGILVDYAGALELLKTSARPMCVSFSRSEPNVRNSSSVIAGERNTSSQTKGEAKNSNDQVFSCLLTFVIFQLT